MSPIGRLAFSAIALTACAPPAPESPPMTARLLRAQTEAMLSAVAVGDAAVWERYLDPRVVYLSEAGELETKTSLLAQLTPLPPGISGSMAIEKFTVEIFGDTAVTTYLARETEDYFGHALKADYVTSDTWRRSPAGWRLIASRVHAKAVDPPAISLPAEQLDECIGTYRLSPEITYAIRREGAGLRGERTGRRAETLLVEARDVLFVAGQPRSRKVLLRDATGRVTALADRREGHDVLWRRDR